MALYSGWAAGMEDIYEMLHFYPLGYLVCHQAALSGLRMQDHKSLCGAAMICVTLADIQTHRQTTFWPVYVNSYKNRVRYCESDKQYSFSTR